MSKLPSLTAKKVIRALKKVGFIEDRQKGSHLVLFQEKTRNRVVVPMHSGRDIKRSLLYAIIDDAKLSVDDFLHLL